MLPEDGDENEDGGDEDDCESGLGDGSRGEWLDFAFRAFAVFFFMPAGECSEEEETDKGEYYGNDAGERLVSACLVEIGRLGKYVHEIRENDHVLELARKPNQIQWILIDCHFIRQSRRIVTAKPVSTIRIYAYAKITHTC